MSSIFRIIFHIIILSNLLFCFGLPEKSSSTLSGSIELIEEIELTESKDDYLDSIPVETFDPFTMLWDILHFCFRYLSSLKPKCYTSKDKPLHTTHCTYAVLSWYLYLFATDPSPPRIALA